MRKSGTHTGDYPMPPAQAEPYIEALGLEDALKFIEAFGGTEIYIAADPKSRSSVVALIGYPKAKALASIIERLPRRVPLVKEWRARVYKSQGLKTVEIARKLGCVESTARLYIKGMNTPKDPDQLSLF
ncbi:helix-turn-helix domain-containing protein [Rhodobacteraceae bacterium M382]|nr:helix-turn-helix domain-containing protein [Rhodobacteraceae bacterium M382]